MTNRLANLGVAVASSLALSLVCEPAVAGGKNTTHPAKNTQPQESVSLNYGTIKQSYSTRKIKDPTTGKVLKSTTTKGQ